MNTKKYKNPSKTLSDILKIMKKLKISLEKISKLKIIENLMTIYFDNLIFEKIQDNFQRKKLLDLEKVHSKCTTKI